MKQKLLLLAAILVVSLNASAQFEQDKLYVGTSLTGLDLSYTGSSKLNLGVEAQAGMFIVDNVLLYGQLAYQHTGSQDSSDYLKAGGGARYYILQNGIFLGANCNYVHGFGNYNDLMPGVEVGYSFFITGNLTIEPSLYYNQSFKNHADYSSVGLKLGMGFYF